MTTFGLPSNIVLYADDDPDDLELVKDSFKRVACRVEVITFDNGSATLSYMQQYSREDPLPCLVILDVNMPFVNGKETLKCLRDMERFRSVPVVLFTTSSHLSDREFARQYGAGFITKPVELKPMECIAEQFMEHCTEETRRQLRNRE